MEYLVGIGLAGLVCGAAAWLGMDRDRSFYPAVTLAVASYYLAFAVVDGRTSVMGAEVVIAAGFVLAAVWGFKRAPWMAILALAAHGVMDGFHHLLVVNDGVPASWPGFCMGFDVTAGALAAGIHGRRARRARPGR